jgi:hypothetical protein
MDVIISMCGNFAQLTLSYISMMWIPWGVTLWTSQYRRMGFHGSDIIDVVIPKLRYMSPMNMPWERCYGHRYFDVL